jgi:hypothetical protein
VLVTRSLALLFALLLAACGSAGTAGLSATLDPSPAHTAAPTVAASPVTSAKGAITLNLPPANATVTSPLGLMGTASVFEAALQWKITDTAGQVIAEGIATASLGAPGRGDFSVTVPYTVPREMLAFVEVYSRSAKDGNIDELVRIPVTLR